MSRRWVSKVGGERRGELLTDGRPSLEILRLLGLSRLGAGAVGKTAQREKKVPQRRFRYGPGAGFHLNMPCQRVSDSCPPKSRPPKNATYRCCPASLLLQVATPPPQNNRALGDEALCRQSPGPDNPRLPVISWDVCSTHYGTVQCSKPDLSLGNPRLLDVLRTCADPPVWPPAVHADALPRFRKVPGVPARGLPLSCPVPSALGINDLTRRHMD